MLSPDPTATTIDPALPPETEPPVLMEIVPDELWLDVPEAIDKAPLVPSRPAFRVDKIKLPDPPLVPFPDDSPTDPPLETAVPAAATMSPEIVSLPPAAICKAPAAAVNADDV